MQATGTVALQQSINQLRKSSISFLKQYLAITARNKKLKTSLNQKWQLACKDKGPLQVS